MPSGGMEAVEEEMGEVQKPEDAPPNSKAISQAFETAHKIVTTGIVEQTIVIALDGSEHAEESVNWYLQKVHRPGNRLVFIHCIELPEMKLNQARSLHMSPGVLAGMWKEEEVKVKAMEERMKGILKERALSGILRTATGKPGEVICRIAEEENAAMIVTGQRGLGKLRRTIMGSVSDYLVHHAHCPVIVCRYPSRSRRGSASSSGRKSRHASGDSVKSSEGSSFDGKRRLSLPQHLESVRRISLQSLHQFEDFLKSRQTSGDSFKSRHKSGESEKSRHKSGQSVNNDDVFVSPTEQVPPKPRTKPPKVDSIKSRSFSLGSETD